MRLTWVLLALGGMALVVLLILAGTGLQETGEPATASVVAPVPAADPPRPRSIKARPVDPALIAAPEVDALQLERVEPRAPLGDIALAMPPRPGVPEPTLLHRPVATAAGRLEAAGHVIALDGIAAVEPDETCRAADGSSWPCGMVARTALRNWLRGRAVECTVGEPPARDAVTSACNLGGEDVAMWLVENGFATAVPGGPYEQAGEDAKAQRRGIFGPGPSD